MKRLHVGVSALSGLLAASGCSQLYEPEAQVSDITPQTVVSSTAGLTHVVVREEASPVLTCAMPPPDAAFDQGDAADFSISLISTGDDAGGEDDDTEEVEMAGRTPAVLITRELFYRACEFSMNFKLSKQEALDLYNKTLETVSAVWATEAGNTTVTVGDTVQTTSQETVQATTTGSVTESEATTDTVSESESDSSSTTTSQ